mgnify:CR=1 FL=1
MPSFFMPKWRWQPVDAPFVALPDESLYGLFITSEIYLGPTWPISWPFWIVSFIDIM